MSTTGIIIGLVAVGALGVGAYLYVKSKETPAAAQNGSTSSQQTGWGFGSAVVETIGALGGSYMNQGYGQGASQSPGWYGSDGDYYGGNWT